MKEYVVKAYSKEGDYIKTWTDIASDIEFNQEINSAGGQLRIILARDVIDYGEGDDIDFGNIIKVYCFDNEATTGTLVFQGFISSYTPNYSDNKIEVIVLSYGQELDGFMLQEALVADANGDTNFTSSGHGVLTWVKDPMSGSTEFTDSFVVASGCTLLGRVDIMYGGVSDVRGRIYTFKRGSTVIATVNVDGAFDLEGGLPYDKVVFSEPIPVTPGETLTWTVDIPSAIIYEFFWFGKTAYTQPVPQRGWSADGTTEVVYASQDPSDILRDIIDKYWAIGGTLNYDVNSIEDTGTTVSYTFNTNTVLEGIKKCLELAPAGWYWYVDYATNLVHFHPKSTSPDHTLFIGKDIKDIQVEKRIEDMINIVYFTGGGDPPLYKKFSDTNSINEYGIKAMKYVDQRVTVEATAQTIADAILGVRSQPELRTTIDVLDSKDDGYDIESIKVGDVVSLRNISDTTGLSLWDFMMWDEDYWDFNIQNLASMEMQIQKLSYKGDIMTINVSTVAPDVNKRIEDINRNLEASQTLNNPSAPS